ncbi:MAG: restriction endonuclease subunit S, partial [Coriobacteriia bacterium]|nr:restriction endonuclease subunit S [Coriobacteriia bacterium]
MSLPTVTLNQAFHYHPGTHGLTEEVLYDALPLSTEDAVPVLSGSEDNLSPLAAIRPRARNNKGKDVVYFTGPAIVLTKDGSAGLMTFWPSGTFTINHHACVLKLRKDCADVIEPEWFALQYRSRLQTYASSQSDNRVLSSEWFDKVRFEIPPMDTQRRVLAKKHELARHLSALTRFRDAAAELRAAQILTPPRCTVVQLGDVLRIVGGNSGLTEEAIYNNWPVGDEAAVSVLSGATSDSKSMGNISGKALVGSKRLKVATGPACVVARKGRAGSTRFVPEGLAFAINDDAYVLTPTKAWRSRIDLRWIGAYLEPLLTQGATSKSDNATLAKSSMERLAIRIPDLAWQRRASEAIQTLDGMITRALEAEASAAAV